MYPLSPPLFLLEELEISPFLGTGVERAPTEQVKEIKILFSLFFLGGVFFFLA